MKIEINKFWYGGKPRYYLMIIDGPREYEGGQTYSRRWDARRGAWRFLLKMAWAIIMGKVKVEG